MRILNISCLQIYICQSRVQHITINSELPGVVRIIILAHEIRHAILHLKAAKMRAFMTFLYMTAPSQMEYEANLFAAEYLLDDELVADRLTEDTFFFSVAKELNVPPELLDFKFRILKRKGWLVESPILANSDFLKKISGGNEPA